MKLRTDPGMNDPELLRTMLPRWSIQVAENIRSGELDRGKPLIELNGIGRGRPAIICGAGPSITSNVLEGIRALQSSGMNPMVICCTTSLGTLLNNGVAPDFVCAIDAGPEIKNHISWYGTILIKGARIPLLSVVWLDPEALKLWHGEKYFFVSSSQPGGPMDAFIYMAERFADSWVAALGCVANAMIFISGQTFGCRKIYLAGVDFCYLYDRAYCERYQVEWDSLTGPVQRIINDGGPKMSHMLTEIDGRHGKTWLANKSMISYRAGLEALIRENREQAQFYTLAKDGVINEELLPYIPIEEVVEKCTLR